MTYDTDNIFAKMLRKEIPAKVVFENDAVLAFHDIMPQAPVHVLLIPKAAYRDATDFFSRASASEIAGYYQGLQATIATLNLSDFRLISNNGEAAGQSVFHFHTHILAGKEFGALLPE
jgi:diadenosine tetraphosphate (Ap4A) HIT family hydrolase